MLPKEADLYVKTRRVMDALVDCLYHNFRDEKTVSLVSRILLINLVNCEIKDPNKAEAILKAIDAAYDEEEPGTP